MMLVPVRNSYTMRGSPTILLLISFTSVFAQQPNATDKVMRSLSDTLTADGFTTRAKQFINLGELDSALAQSVLGLRYLEAATPQVKELFVWNFRLMKAQKLHGMIEFYQGEYDRALKSMQAYQRTAKAVGSQTDVGAAFNYMSYCFRSMNDAVQAKKAAQQAIEVLRTLPVSDDLANAYTGLASAYADERELDSTLTYNRLALTIYERTGNTANATNTWLNMADSWALIGRYDSCRTVLEHARNGTGPDGFPDARMKYHAHWGAVHFVDGELLLAKLFLDSAMLLANDLENAESKAHIGDLLALTAAAQHQNREAILLQRAARESLLDDLDLGKARSLTEARLDYEHEIERIRTNDQLDRQRRQNMFTMAVAVASIVAAILLFLLYRNTRKARIAIQREKEVSESLLLNILPAEVADELKRTGHAEARQFDRATILFSDFKEFTPMSEAMSATDLVEELNACFEAFDTIITRHGVEKIKTIGDAYMAAGGLPDPKASTPIDVVNAALDMQTFISTRKKEREQHGLLAFDMRIGIHTGPVVAGIVGVKKFQYDIWGDTVNTANRMETLGEVGEVNISEATYQLIKSSSDLRFSPRGKVPVKGKGEMEMFFVHHPGPTFQDPFTIVHGT